ncbi:MAG: hypothetical protein ACJ77K_12240 [Bacteroidia bacterium]
MMNRSGKISILLLVLLLFGAGVLIYGPTLQLFPSFIHAWTQSDRYAIALRFLDNGFDLFHPATFNYQTVNGITRVDFPINEYLVAVIMKISGSTSPAIFRIYTFCVSIFGLVFLFLLSEKLTGSKLRSLIVVVFVFFSPVYFYYQAGFLPSIPAISCLFAAYYYFVCYRESLSRKKFNMSVFFFLLAALMRFPFIIFLFALALEQLWIVVKSKKLISWKWSAFFFAFVIFGAYYLYNVHLGRLYGNMFLDTVMPARKPGEMKAVLSEMYDHWRFHYFTTAHYIFILGLIFVASIQLIRTKRMTSQLKEYGMHFGIAGLGAFFYFLLMARQFVAHDYYFLDSLFVPVVLLFILLLHAASENAIFNKVSWCVVAVAFTVVAGISCRNIQNERYTTGPWDRTEITRRNFTGTAAFLDEKGISKEAKILVIDAYTTNAPLILMNRKGYTVMGTTAKNISQTLAWAQWDYVAIQDDYIISDVVRSYPVITSMLTRVCGNGKVSFYRRSKNYQPKSMEEFLGIEPQNIRRSEWSGEEVQLNADMEFGKATTADSTYHLFKEKGLRALADFYFQGKDLSGMKVVASYGGDYYQDFRLTDYFKASGQWQHAIFQFALPDSVAPSSELKIYLWNSEKKELSYKYWNVTVYK